MRIRLLLAVSALFFAAAGHAQIQHPYAEGVVLVGYQRGLPEEARAVARAQAGVQSAAALSPLDKNAEKLVLRRGVSVPQAIEALRRNPNVRYAEPDYIVRRTATSNDPAFTNGTLWGMYGASTSPANQYGSNAAAAWAAGHTGSRQVYVGVIDEGIQVTHPDLQANMWANPFEDCTDGIDNDGNGYVDDCHGWDFHNNDKAVFDSAADDSHGTHVAGTIGGVGGNGTGVAGVNWAVTMISGKFLGPNGGSISNAIRAVDYFTALKIRHGLNIVATSNSWGGGGFSQAMLDAIERGGDQGILFIAAAGNSGTNNDTTASYPSGYSCTLTASGQQRGWDCVIAVASTTSTGGLSSFSQYGAVTVDIGAPGSSIYSTLPTNTYGTYSGTSMATPHVSGAAALCASINPALTAPEIRQKIMSTAAPTAALSGKTVTGGRLDVGAMAAACEPATVAPTGAITNLTATAVSTASIGLSWADMVTSEARFDVQQGPAGCGSFTASTSVAAGSTGATITGLQPGTTYCFRVAGANSIGVGEWSNTASATTLAPPAAPTSLSVALSTATSAALSWVDNSSNETGFRIERATGTGGFALLANVAANVAGYTNSGLASSTTYRYRVQATGSGANSAYSNEVSITTPAAPPAAPSNVSATLSKDRRTVTISWRDRSSNEQGFEVWRLQRNANGTWPTAITDNMTRVGTVGAGVTRSTNQPGINGTFRYFVRSYNSGGASVSGLVGSSSTGVTTVP